MPCVSIYSWSWSLSLYQILQKLVQQERVEHQGEMRYLTGGSRINVMARRNYLYEDAFDRLTPENGRRLKIRLSIIP